MWICWGVAGGEVTNIHFIARSMTKSLKRERDGDRVRWGRAVRLQKGNRNNLAGPSEELKEVC